jgi:HEAT repeat protein
VRRQDELIALYQGRGRHAQKYLLSQMGRLALAFDSEELLEFLQAQTAHDDPVVASQALASLLEFLPSYVQKRYAIRESTSGAWTQLLMDAAATQAALARAEKVMTRANEITQAAMLTARPLASALLGKVGERGWTRTASLITLGQLELASVRTRLDAELAASPDLVLARSVARLHAAEPRALIELVQRLAPSNPDHFLLLANAPPAQAFPVLMDSAAGTDTIGRMNLAQVLGSLRGVDTIAAFDRLYAAGEGWVLVTLLDALERLGVPAAIDKIRQVYASMEDDFVRVNAVRAAGGLRGPASIEFCLGAAREGSWAVRAAALESLARLGVPAEKIAHVAKHMLEAPQMKAKVNAILSMLSPEEALDAKPMGELLMSPDPLGRLEAAFCLGYLQTPRALAFLTAFANLDPSPSVRQQAAKSLSRYPAKESLPHLIGMVRCGQPRIALTATRALTRYGTVDSDEAVLAITQALDASTVPLERALLYRALGQVAQRKRSDAARGALAAGLAEKDTLPLAGVVEGWNLVGAQGEAEVMKALKKLAGLADPRLRARALTALWSAGDVDALAGLGELISGGEEKAIGPALECALEVGLLIPDALVENRFPGLVERLIDISETDEHSRAAREQLVTSGERTVPVEAPGGEDEAFEVRRGSDPDEPEVDQGAQTLITDAGPGPAAVTLPPTPAPTLPPTPAPTLPPMPAPLSETLPPTPALLAETLPPTPAPLFEKLPPTPVPTMMAPVPGPTDPLPVPAPPPPRVPTGRATARVAPLKNFLNSLDPAKTPEIADSLSKNSYMVADKIAERPAPASRAPTSRVRVSAPPPPPAAGPPPAVLAGGAALAVLLLAGIGWFALGGSAQPSGAPGHLWVESVDGPATSAKGRALETRTVIEPGDGAKTGDKAKLTLVTPGGDRVVLSPNSAVTFGGIEPSGTATRYRFQDAAGEVALDFKTTGELELRSGPRRIRAGKAMVLVTRDRKAPSLTVVSGTAALTHDKGGDAITLRSGDTIGLE